MRMQRMGLVLLVVGIGVTIGRADDKPLDQTELKKQIVKTVFDSASLGTEIFNKGNFEGCYRLYQGTLMAIQPLLPLLDLPNRTKLTQTVKDKLDRAKTMSAVDGAFALRAALDEIQNEIAPPLNTKSDTPGVKPETKGKTLWDRLGNAAGVQKIVHSILLKAIEDPKVKFLRSNKKLDARALEQSLVEYISSVTGGILPYKGKDMKTVHAGMKITDDEFNALAAIVEDTLKTNGIDPADIKDFMAILESTRKDIVEIKSKN